MVLSHFLYFYFEKAAQFLKALMKHYICTLAFSHQADNTNLRLERDRLVSDLDRVRLELSEKTSLSERQSSLIVELEEHVEKLQQMTDGIDRGEAEGRSSTDFLVAELDLGGESPSRSMSMSPLQSPDLMQKSFNEASSLLPIVQVCFRERVLESRLGIRNQLRSRNITAHLNSIFNMALTSTRGPPVTDSLKLMPLLAH